VNHFPTLKATMMLPKTEYVRSPKLMQAYRQIPCQHCGVDDGTVCGAHSNAAEHGKGRGIKASDDRAASLCHRCHIAVDQGRSMSRTERVRVWTEAHVKTVAELVRRKLWPTGVAVPEFK
jgi:hypothetical protein